jgi:regulatory factor X
MARMLQAENARQSTDSPIDSPLLQPAQQSQQHIQDQFQQPYYPQPSSIMYQQQPMDYPYQPVAQHAMASAAVRVDMETKRPRLSTNHTNENELKDMLQKNISRPLDQVADEVIANERTSSSEKSKQLFAMLWYVPSHLGQSANSSGSTPTLSRPRAPSRGLESTLSMRLAAQSTISSL